MPAPLVSLCIPTWNRREQVQSAVRACLAQTWPNKRVIVVDNASTDGTPEALADLAAQHPEVLRIHVNPQNLGMVGNFQRCLDLADGEYLKIVCSDDRPAPSLVEKQIAALEAHPRAVACAARRRRHTDRWMFRAYDPLVQLRGGLWTGEDAVRRVYRVSNGIGGPVQLLTRLAPLREMVFRDDPRVGMFFDIDPVLRLLARGWDLHVLPEALCDYDSGDGSHTTRTLLDPAVQRAFYTYRDVMAADPDLSRCLRLPADRTTSRRNASLLLLLAGWSAGGDDPDRLRPLYDLVEQEHGTAAIRFARRLLEGVAGVRRRRAPSTRE